MADFLAVRTRLVKEAGRFDLVVDAENDDYDDAGANNVINGAIRWLNEQRQDLPDYVTGGVALLSGDTDTNFWTLYHEELLISACRLMLEQRHRNSQGVNDWLATPYIGVIGQVDLIYRNAVDKKLKTDITAGTTERRIQV